MEKNRPAGVLSFMSKRKKVSLSTWDSLACLSDSKHEGPEEEVHRLTDNEGGRQRGGERGEDTHTHTGRGGGDSGTHPLHCRFRPADLRSAVSLLISEGRRRALPVTAAMTDRRGR